MQNSHARYKSSYDRRVQETAPFHVGSCFFLYTLSIATASESSAHALARSTYDKPRQETPGPYRNLEAQASTETTSKYIVLNIVSINRAVYAPNTYAKHRIGETPHEVKQMASVKTPKRKPAKPISHKACSTNGHDVIANNPTYRVTLARKIHRSLI